MPSETSLGNSHRRLTCIDPCSWTDTYHPEKWGTRASRYRVQFNEGQLLPFLETQVRVKEFLHIFISLFMEPLLQRSYLFRIARPERFRLQGL